MTHMLHFVVDCSTALGLIQKSLLNFVVSMSPNNKIISVVCLSIIDSHIFCIMLNKGGGTVLMFKLNMSYKLIFYIYLLILEFAVTYKEG